MDLPLFLVCFCFLVLFAIVGVGATAESLFSGFREPSFESGGQVRASERHPRASIHVGHTCDRDRVSTPTEPHVGHFDDTRFETAAYKALVAGAEERIDRLHHADGSDL